MKLFGLETDRITKKVPHLDGFGEPAHRRRDWRILLSVALVVFLALGAFSGYVFYRVESGTFAQNSQASSTSEAITIDRDELNNVISEFRKDEATFELLQGRQPDVPNPS